jgi:adenosylmethionine-8-amino-7-oxononanoate aminotransferase
MYSKKEIESLKSDAVKHIIPHYAVNKLLKENPKIYTRGEGCYVYDIEGNKYFDTFAGLLTTICGHGRKEVIEGINEVLNEMAFFPNFVDLFTVPQIKLAKKLDEIMPGDLSVSFFVNSGSEACETAIKIAKQYHWQRGEKGRYKIIGRRGSYHATTLGGISATGLNWFREPFEPLIPGFLIGPSAQCSHCEFNLNPETCKMDCLESLKDLILWEKPETVAAVILDPIPGSNSGYPLPKDGYLQGLRDFCDEYGILLIFDEVQTGFGKSGKMFACQHWNVVPDLMALGKGFSGGYIPLGATVMKEKIHEEFTEPGKELRSGSTFGGHNAACIAALNIIEIIEKEKLVENAEKMGLLIKEKLNELKKYRIVGDIRGIGLLVALELAKDRESMSPIDLKLEVGGWIRDYCYKKGMILRNNGDILVIAPALIINESEINFMIDIFDEAISAASKHYNLT